MKRLMIFVLVLFFQSCSWVTDFYIVNRSGKNIIITYFNKQGGFNNEVQHFREQARKRYPKVLWKRDMSI